MKGATSDVSEFWRRTPAGCNSISTSCGSATAASVPSNGRYANDAVEPSAIARPPIVAHVSDDGDRIFEIRRFNCIEQSLEIENLRHRAVHPYCSRLCRCRADRQKQPID